MKILLLGEFSGLHKNLKEGLSYHGCNAEIASTGDGWKAIKPDIDLPVCTHNIFSRLILRIKLYYKLSKLRGYDVVQIVSPFIFPYRFFPYKRLLKKIKKNNGRLFLVAAGSDSYFWRFGKKKLRYGPFDDFLRYDLKAVRYKRESERAFSFNKFVADNVDGIIPIMFEYQISYVSHPRLLDVIPIPINIDKIKYRPNVPGEKIIIFHGLSRYGFKGTRHVEEAFRYLKDKYSDKVECIIDGKMSLPSYLKLMESTNIVVDQTNMYSSGVNGIYALAMGKLVLGGAEKESLASLGVDESPIINILPSAQDIITKIEYLLQRKNDFEELGKASRKFAMRVHEYRDVSKKYIETWSSVN